MESSSGSLSRRRFLARGVTLAAVGSPAALLAAGEDSMEQGKTAQPPEASDSDITAQTVAEAQKIAGLEFTEAEREGIAEGMARRVAQYERRRKLVFPNSLAPATVFRTPFEGEHGAPATVLSRSPKGGRLPTRDEDIAFAPVTALSRWIESRELTSRRLTEIYLERLKTIGPKLECVITLTEDLARRQAERADDEIASGRYRGPLHGIPWGAKDLFDTAGIRTTWGAKPYQNRVPERDAIVVERLENAGAVLIAKTTLGALAYGDIWYGGKTRNPWNPEQGSSGSSAGSAAATAAGLVGFSLGTETLGSIVSPCMRCGTTGLRPTFGRVPRTGAMALCWSLDKIGPICRSVEDTALILAAIHGQDPGDPSSVDVPFRFDATRSVAGLRIGYAPSWFEGRRVTDLDRRFLEAATACGFELVEIDLPDWPYGSLRTILNVEAAAAFEELTLTNRDDDLVWQAPQAWPNTFRQTWFVPAIELVQAQRFRTMVSAMMDEKFAGLDAMMGPSYAGSMLLITNNTGHPSLTLRVGFREGNQPHGATLWGKPFEEGTIARIGMALEEHLDVWDRRPVIG